MLQSAERSWGNATTAVNQTYIALHTNRDEGSQIIVTAVPCSCLATFRYQQPKRGPRTSAHRRSLPLTAHAPHHHRGYDRVTRIRDCSLRPPTNISSFSPSWAPLEHPVPLLSTTQPLDTPTLQVRAPQTASPPSNPSRVGKETSEDLTAEKREYRSSGRDATAAKSAKAKGASSTP